MAHYGTDAGLDAYWQGRGYDTASLTPELRLSLLTKASGYVDGLGFTASVGRRSILWPGTPASPTQERQWPRVGASDAYGNTFTGAEIPAQIDRAVYEAAYHINSGVDTNSVTRSDRTVIREKIDVLETQYATPQAGEAIDARPIIPEVSNHLATLLGTGAGSSASEYGITQLVV